MKKKTEEERIYIVSDIFIQVFENFNVCSQFSKMKDLERKELLLLLLLAADSFSEDSNISNENYIPFKEELKLVGFIQNEDSISNDSDILELIEKTGDKFIDVTCLRDKDGNKLPLPLSEEEALVKRRDIGIDQIIN